MRAVEDQRETKRKLALSFLFLSLYMLTLCTNTSRSVDPTGTDTATRQSSGEALSSEAATAAADLSGGSCDGAASFFPLSAASASSAASLARASAASAASGVTEAAMRRIPGKEEEVVGHVFFFFCEPLITFFSLLSLFLSRSNDAATPQSSPEKQQRPAAEGSYRA